ncbi:MAG: crossover junction endodeoxyribonuclease RuvC [Planctomycetota bacterium]
MRILGIDPGLRITGYGCVAGEPVRPELIEAGVIRLVRGETPPVADRLLELERDLCDLLDRVRPEAVVVEAVFSHAKFPASALTMAHARGVVLLCAKRAGLDLVEIPPASVKRALTGSGRASKEQMQASIQGVFGLAEPPSPPDVADALAIAIAGSVRLGAPG